MKLLFDENLSRKLVRRLSDLFPDSAHVSTLGLERTDDAEIWQRAGAAGYRIVTTDGDFYEMSLQMGPPPQVIWLRDWRHPTKDAELVLRREAIRIASLEADSELAVLLLEL